ncbi:hypothetical protein L195_g027236, partial [Trifolium pratense]
MIHNMVSERYPRDEDEDSVADFDSAIEKHEDLFRAAAMEVSASEIQPSTLCNHIFFGIRGNCNNESAFAASEDDEKSKNLDSEVVASEAIKGLNHNESEFRVSAEIKQSENQVKGRVPLRSWFYVGKQKQHINDTAINNQVWPFDLHDECIVDFDPDGRANSISSFTACKICCNVQLWWMPWDRGKKPFDIGRNLLSIIIEKQNQEKVAQESNNSSFEFNVHAKEDGLSSASLM